MGNVESQFEEQFRGLYRFVGVVEDRCFKGVRIYRKAKFNFDYMMVVQRPVAEFESGEGGGSKPQELNNRLQLIRKYQNGYTARLSYSMIIEGSGIRCAAPLVRLYLEYYNHTLNDYLSALRANQFILTLTELMFVAHSLAEGVLVLKKMEIRDFWLTLDNIWVSVDQGNVVLNPSYFIYEAALMDTRSQQVNRITTEFKPIDLASSRSHSQANYHSFHSIPQLDPLEQTQLQNILEVYVEMTRYLSPSQLPSANRLYAKLKRCRLLTELEPHLLTSCEQLSVEQFGEVKEGQSLYARKLE